MAMICCERRLPHGGRSGGEKVWQPGGGGAAGGSSRCEGKKKNACCCVDRWRLALMVFLLLFVGLAAGGGCSGLGEEAGGKRCCGSWCWAGGKG